MLGLKMGLGVGSNFEREKGLALVADVLLIGPCRIHGRTVGLSF